MSAKHGAVVMLYDPCTQPALVDRLRKLVTSCIRKHVITPYGLLPPERPLALVTWGCKLLMNQVDDGQVIKFIRVSALAHLLDCLTDPLDTGARDGCPREPCHDGWSVRLQAGEGG